MVFSEKTIEQVPEIHQSTQRLYQAARDLRDVTGQSAVARLLGATPQVVKNWEARGISSDGALLAQKIIGCNANWLLEGITRMRDDSWLPEPAYAKQPSAPIYTIKTDVDWPFRDVTKEEFAHLSDLDKGQIEGFVKSLLRPAPSKQQSNGAPT